MSKSFMYGLELQELEQLMILVPNFLPRRSGVIVVQKMRNEEGSTGFERDMNASQRIVNQIQPIASHIKLPEATLIMKRLSAASSKNANLII
jgi:hypothetical protein